MNFINPLYIFIFSIFVTTGFADTVGLTSDLRVRSEFKHAIISLGQALVLLPMTSQERLKFKPQIFLNYALSIKTECANRRQWEEMHGTEDNWAYVFVSDRKNKPNKTTITLNCEIGPTAWHNYLSSDKIDNNVLLARQVLLVMDTMGQVEERSNRRGSKSLQEVLETP